MACRAIQLHISGEVMARVTALPQPVSGGQISAWPPQLAQLAPTAATVCTLCPERSLTEGSCVAAPGAGPSMLCRPVAAGRVANTCRPNSMKGTVRASAPLTLTFPRVPSLCRLLGRDKPGVQENGS